MKKLIAVSIILVLFSGMAFAQMADGLKLGAWGRTAVVPFEARFMKDAADGHDGDTDLSAAQGQTWGGAFGRVRMDFSGANEFIGFNMQIQSDGGTPGFGDNAGVWVQPFNWLRLDLGLFKYDRLRGKVAGDTDYHQFTLSNYSGDAIFQRFSGGTPGQSGGALLSIIPMEALYIGAMIPNFPGINGWNAQYGANTPVMDKFTTPPVDHDNDPSTPNITIDIPVQVATTSVYAKTIYENVQIAAAYEFADAGLFRVQYVGGADTAYTSKRVELAFALTAIENLLVDAGVKIFMPFTQLVDADNDDSIPINNAHQFNVGATYSIGDFGIMAKVDTAFAAQNGDKKWVAPFGINIHLVPQINLGFATIGLEIGMEAASESKYDGTGAEDDYFNFGAGLWAMKDLGKGYIKAGLTFSTIDVGDAEDVTSGFFRIPIVAQFAF